MVNFVFEAFGVPVAIEVPHTTSVPQLAPYLPYGWLRTPHAVPICRYTLRVASDPSGSPLVVLYRDAESLLASADLDQILMALERDLRWLLAERATDWIFVHAGAVGWHGRAIVLPGESGAGKSTLVAELVQAGASYYSDEYAVLDMEGRVHPFATPLQLRLDGDSGQVRRTVEELGGNRGDRPLPIGLIAAVVFRPEGANRLVEMTPANAVLRLLGHCATRAEPGTILETLGAVASQARAFSGERGEAGAFARHLLQWVDSAGAEGR